MLKNIVLLGIALSVRDTQPYDEYYWNGKWFPHSPSEIDSNPLVPLKNVTHKENHGIQMGIKDANCDDAKSNLSMDWFMGPENFTCFANRKLFLPRSGVHPIHTIEHIPLLYIAPHKCMNESIEYSVDIPTFGAHRPLWAAYGEFAFLPKQRWIHNLEHGAVVMLYHPCANKNQVNLLRKIVRSCLFKHIITPYNLLTAERPLALLTWGHRLEMSKVSHEVAMDFIKTYALRGPEKIPRDGQYTLMIQQHAQIISDMDDTNVCPNYDNIHMK